MQNRKYINGLNFFGQYQIIDLRNKAGFIPNSISFPVLTQEEIRTIKNVGFSHKKGKEIVLQTQKKIDKLKSSLDAKPLLLLCKDGGITSKFVWEYLRVTHQTHIYKGGFRQLKRAFKQLFSSRFNAYVICGLTGCGKTEIIELLEKKNVQTLNLEKLANHAGSVFGNLKNQPQPTQQQFEINLAFALLEINASQPLVLEYEKANIGNLQIPDEIINLINTAKPILINSSKKTRVNRLVKSYF